MFSIKNTNYATKFYRCFVLFAAALIIVLNADAQDIDDNDKNVISRGRGFVNLAFSLDQREAENENQFFRDVLDQDRLNYQITSNGGYAIKDNFVLGLGLGYGRSREDLKQIDQDGEEVFIRSVGQNFTIAPNIRNYIPLSNDKFYIFIQTDLRLNFGESLNRKIFTDEVEKLETEFFQTRIGVSPGLLIFFNRSWAFETSVGLVGLTSRWTTETFNNDTENRTKIQENNMDLQLNLLALNLGVAYYFD